MLKSSLRWCTGSEPARGVDDKFWCTCNSAGRVDEQPCPVWLKEIVTIPLPTVIRPRVSSTWVGQPGGDESLETVPVAPADVVAAFAVVLPPALVPDAEGAATACWAPAAINNAATSRAADRAAAGRHDMGLVVII